MRTSLSLSQRYYCETDISLGNQKDFGKKMKKKKTKRKTGFSFSFF